MKTLATRLAWAREQKKLSQAELAKKSGVSQSTIGNLEAGIRLTARSITVIATALGVNPVWLADGKGEPYREVVQNDRVVYPSDIQDVIDLMLKTDERGRLKIKLAAIDAFELHNSHILRARTNTFTEEEMELVETMRDSTPMSKKIIKAAVTGAEKNESSTSHKKAG